jgi:hypothetical protein
MKNYEKIRGVAMYLTVLWREVDFAEFMSE